MISYQIYMSSSKIWAIYLVNYNFNLKQGKKKKFIHQNCTHFQLNNVIWEPVQHTRSTWGPVKLRKLQAKTDKLLPKLQFEPHFFSKLHTISTQKCNLGTTLHLRGNSSACQIYMRSSQNWGIYEKKLDKLLPILQFEPNFFRNCVKFQLKIVTG